MINHEAILRLANKRLPPREIADRLNLEPGQVSNALTRMRRNGEDIPKFSVRTINGPRPRVPVEPHVRDVLKPYAQERGCDVTDLAGRILDRVVVDDLIEAVLDDGGADGH